MFGTETEVDDAHEEVVEPREPLAPEYTTTISVLEPKSQGSLLDTLSYQN